MKIISFSSGKGGVGKTSMTSNVAVGLAQLGKKVLILDGDLGMANVDIFFGVHLPVNLHEVFFAVKLAVVCTRACRRTIWMFATYHSWPPF